MSFGGGKQPEIPSSTTSTVTQKNEPPAWLKPYGEKTLSTGWGMAQQGFNPYTGLSMAPLSPQQQAAMYLGTQYGTQGSVMDTYRQLADNPLLADQIRMAQHEVMPDIGYQQLSSGSYGNSGLNEAAARTYGDIASNMRFQNLSQAMQMAPQYRQQGWEDIARLMGIGDVARTYQQQLLDEATGRWSEAQQWPYSQLDWFTNLLSRAGYGSGAGATTGTTSGTQTQANPYQSSAMANLVGAGMLAGGLYDILSS